MMASSDATPELVTFRDGFVADLRLVERMIAIESRAAGCFRLEDAGRFRVVPPSILTPDDVAVLRARRDEVRQIIEYVERMCEAPL